MSLIKLRIEGLRNLSPVSIEPEPGLNYIVGPNASGKTSLLEAIYLLSRARSFRSPHVHQLVQFGAPLLTVSGQVVSPEADRVTLGIQLAKGHREIHLKGRPVASSAALMRVFPLLVIQPSGIALLEGPPKLRRNFMDFLVALLRVILCPNPLCKRKILLTLHQVRERSAWETSERDGKSDQRVLVARLRCAACDTTYTLLPDFLYPFVVTRPLFSMVC